MPICRPLFHCICPVSLKTKKNQPTKLLNYWNFIKNLSRNSQDVQLTPLCAWLDYSVRLNCNYYYIQNVSKWNLIIRWSICCWLSSMFITTTVVKPAINLQTKACQNDLKFTCFKVLFSRVDKKFKNVLQYNNLCSLNSNKCHMTSGFYSQEYLDQLQVNSPVIRRLFLFFSS